MHQHFAISGAKGSGNSLPQQKDCLELLGHDGNLFLVSVIILFKFLIDNVPPYCLLPGWMTFIILPSPYAITRHFCI